MYSGYGKLYDTVAYSADENGNKIPLVSFEGEYTRGLVKGNGTSYRYECRVEEQGKEVYYVSAKYSGKWKDGYRNGYGVHSLYDADGNTIEKYTGEFKDGVYNGAFL